MHCRTKVAVIVAALVVCLAAPTLGAQSRDAESAVARRVRTYFSAMGKGEIAEIEDALADDYSVIGGDGKVETRVERLAWLRRNAAAVAAVTPTEVRVRVYATAAVATGLVVIPSDAAGPPVRERFTQVWVRRDGKWRMVAGQITIVKE